VGWRKGRAQPLETPSLVRRRNSILRSDGFRIDGGIMRGIDFVTNKRGQKTAVLIDLKRHGQLWEDFYDSVIARNRARERGSL
jgi:hypothetical protein